MLIAVTFVKLWNNVLGTPPVKPVWPAKQYCVLTKLFFNGCNKLAGILPVKLHPVKKWYKPVNDCAFAKKSSGNWPVIPRHPLKKRQCSPLFKPVFLTESIIILACSIVILLHPPNASDELVLALKSISLGIPVNFEQV